MTEIAVWDLIMSKERTDAICSWHNTQNRNSEAQKDIEQFVKNIKR